MSSTSNMYLDSETTGFSWRHDHVLQLAAAMNEATFNRYIMTDRKIPDKITQITGISSATLTENNAQPFDVVAEEFMSWIQTHAGSDVRIVAHNAKFDVLFLLSRLRHHFGDEGARQRIQAARLCVVFDTLRFCRLIQKKVGNDVKVHNKLSDLHMRYLHKPIDTNEAHNALYDTCTLQKIVESDAFQFEMAFYQDQVKEATMTMDELWNTAVRPPSPPRTRARGVKRKRTVSIPEVLAALSPPQQRPRSPVQEPEPAPVSTTGKNVVTVREFFARSHTGTGDSETGDPEFREKLNQFFDSFVLKRKTDTL